MISVFYVLAIFYPVHQFSGYLMQLPVAFRFLFCRFLGSVVILGGLSLVNSLHAYTFASLKRKKLISTTPLNDALNALILALNASAAAFVLLFTKKFKILS